LSRDIELQINRCSSLKEKDKIDKCKKHIEESKDHYEKLSSKYYDMKNKLYNKLSDVPTKEIEDMYNESSLYNRSKNVLEEGFFGGFLLGLAGLAVVGGSIGYAAEKIKNKLNWEVRRCNIKKGEDKDKCLEEVRNKMKNYLRSIKSECNTLPQNKKEVCMKKMENLIKKL
jgi:hypothetical protein